MIEAFQLGLLAQTVQDSLLADINAQLLRLESGDADAAAVRKPAAGRAGVSFPEE